jgi:hypothetical protein
MSLFDIILRNYEVDDIMLDNIMLDTKKYNL